MNIKEEISAAQKECDKKIIEILHRRKSEIESQVMGKVVRDAYAALIVDTVTVDEKAKTYILEGFDARHDSGSIIKKMTRSYSLTYSQVFSSYNLEWFKSRNRIKSGVVISNLMKAKRCYDDNQS